jgi:hypothetical protein
MSRCLPAIAVGLVGCGVLVAAAHAEPLTAPREASPAAVVAKAEPTVLRAGVRALQQTAADWQGWLASVPALRPYAEDFALFTPNATDDALSRGKRSRSNIGAWRFLDGPFEWTVGDRVFWVVSGKNRTASLLAVFAPGGAAPEHRASLLIAEPDAPLAIGWNAVHPSELLFTTCYGCPGQSGSIQLTADGQPMFVYR